MDLHAAGPRPTWRAAGHPPISRGAGDSQWGYTRIQAALKNGVTCRPFYRREHPQGRGSPTAWRAADGLAHAPTCAYAAPWAGRLLYHRSLDRSRATDVLHAVGHRAALAPGPCERSHAA